ncbi:hypothetical protein DFQ04_1342 [Algoriphagus boseongensis]|uniref:Uncharacterized protein n=1 Tax=Algoriphagus boseongensis TaxID=1442587 RepID=A0A4R6TBD1_9BACT|nr:hypothetical protein [Algoriphagus boseongensis]TDQ19519.1 hypothetical protein DFQ04_1342 [Algoriphagus boseongensis]
MLKRIPNPSKVKGIKVVESFVLAKGSAICLPGFGILISSSIPESIRLEIIQHEYGHYLDYLFGIEGDRKKFLGSAFLGFYLKIGLPSLLNLIPGFNRLPWFKGSHRVFWTEIRANRLAHTYFQNDLAEGFSRRFPTQD